MAFLHFCPFFGMIVDSAFGELNFGKSSNICIPKIWQKMKKSLVQLAINPFLHCTSKTRNPDCGSPKSIIICNLCLISLFVIICLLQFSDVVGMCLIFHTAEFSMQKFYFSCTLSIVLAMCCQWNMVWAYIQNFQVLLCKWWYLLIWPHFRTNLQQCASTALIILMVVVVSEIHLVDLREIKKQIHLVSRQPLLILLIGQLTWMASSYHRSSMCHVCWQF